jgi:hypothetical protein
MLAASVWSAWLILVASLGADDALVDGPPLKAVPEPVSVVAKPRRYVVYVKLVEVDEQGRETVLGQPVLRTAGGDTGISINQPDGRRFDVTVTVHGKVDGTEPQPLLAPLKPVGDEADVSLRQKLQQKISFNANQQRRREALRDIAKTAGINIAVDPESGERLAGEFDAAVDLKVDDKPVSEIIEKLVEPLNLVYVVKHEVVVIGTAERLLPREDEFVIKTYDVADLIGMTKVGDAVVPDFTPLIQRIKTTVQPESWNRKDAAASVRSFSSTYSLVVRQTPEGHAEIERLLRAKRAEPPKRLED